MRAGQGYGVSAKEGRVRVEFFGIPRQRAGVVAYTCDASTLGGVIAALAAQFPRFAEACTDGEHLRAGYIANLNGQRFVSAPETPLGPDDALLILSADAGG